MQVLTTIFLFITKHRWFSGRMLACHVGGPGSIPGRCNQFFAVNIAHYLSIFFLNKQIYCERNFRKSSRFEGQYGRVA
jgi:hypothetical protein